MVDVKRILEIKKNGEASANADDVSMFLKTMCEFINTDADAKKLIKDQKLSAGMDVKGAGKFVLSIDKGKCEFAKKDVAGTSFKLFCDIKTLAEIIIAKTDAAITFLRGDLELDGDFEKLVAFFELLELASEKLGIFKKGERKALVDAKTMKKLYEVYKAGAEEIDPNEIPLFFNIFCSFVNSNPEAQEIVEGQKIRVQMNISDIDKSYVIEVKDGKMSWSDKKITDAILEFTTAIKTAASVLLGGDAASAYLSGEVTATGNIQQALVLQELIELFLELLPFTQ